MNILCEMAPRKPDLSEATLSNLIEFLKSHECLWNVRSPEFANKHKRVAANKAMIELLREDPKGSTWTVKKATNHITRWRIAVRKEQDKVSINI